MGANGRWTARWGLAVLIGSVWLGGVHIERVKRLRGPLGCRHVRHGFYRRGDGTVVRGPMEECNLIAVPPGRR